MNGITMTASALLMRSVAIAFNSYVAKAAGAEAVGLYSLLSGIYGFSLTFALSGISLSVTRLVSEYLAVGNNRRVVIILKRAFGIALMFGGTASAILFFLSDHLASGWLHDLRIVPPLKILCATLPAAAISSVINGYFIAVRRILNNAISQFTELTIKIVATVLLFSTFGTDNASIVCIILALGGVIAELLSLLLNLSLYFFDRKRHLETSEIRSDGRICRQMLGISMPIALTSYVRSALVSLEHTLIPKGLIKHGADRTAALSAYGTLGSMALTVINFPYALIGSFSSLIIPEITESRAQGKKRHLQYLAFRIYQSSAVFSFLMMGIFFDFSKELGMILYSSPLAGEYIRILSFIVPIMYTDTVTDSILKGMGEQLYAMKVNITDAVISVTLVYFLVPEFGIPGYIFTIYVAEAINAALSIYKAFRICRIDIKILSVYIRSFLASAAGIILSRLSGGGFTFIRLIIYVITSMAITRLTLVFSKEDIIWLKNFFVREPELNKKRPTPAGMHRKQ